MNESNLYKKDLLEISEYFKMMREKLTIFDIRKIMARASEINIMDEKINLYINEFFINEASRIITMKVCFTHYYRKNGLKSMNLFLVIV